MVVAVAVLELLIVELVDVLADLVRSGEVHRGASYGEDLTGGHIGVVHGSEAGRIDIDNVVADAVARRVAAQVEV